MKYKVLLIGKGNAVIDDFFIHLDEDFEVQTSSTRYKDIMSHLRYFKPDVMVFCLYKESGESINTVEAFKQKLHNLHIPLVVIGNQEECDDFEKETYRMSSLVLTKPISVRGIHDKIVEFMGNWQAMEEAEEIKSLYGMEADCQSETFHKDVLEKKQDNILESYTLERELEHQESTKENPEKTAVKEKKHVLVVDDDPMMLKLIKEQLKETYAVGTAINGNLAIKFLENKKTDLIILDYEMPGENGAQVLERIRKNEMTANLPVIFLTGMSDRDKIQKVLSLRPQGYLLKPIDREKLMDIIEKNIG
ncbi:MAG: response regulator [Thermoflexaceae bacterium]|nr:response regulator [Thermoflexaceae bacterium]